MEENVYFNISQCACCGTDDRRWFAKTERSPNVDLHSIQKSVHLWDDTLKTEYCARGTVKTPTIGMQARRGLQRAYCTVQYLENAMRPPRLPPVGCTGEVPTCLIHPTCRMKGKRVTPSWLCYSQVWQILGPSLRATLWSVYLPEGRDYLEFPVYHHCFLPLSKEDLPTNYDLFDAITFY